MHIHTCGDTATTPAAAPSSFEDPLAPDASDDVTVVTTRRGLSRLALVAAETAARFERSGIRHEPMAWLLAPRRMFDGAPAVDACLELDACARAVLLHRLDAGLDAEPAYLDWLGDGQDEDDDEVEDEDVPDAIAHCHRVGGVTATPYPGGAHAPFGAKRDAARSGDGDETPSSAASGRVGSGRRAVDRAGLEPGARRGTRAGSARSPDGRVALRLFTAVVTDDGRDGHVQAFAAAVVASREAFRAALNGRYGDAARDAVVLEGFDPSDPLVGALVSPAIADVLEQVAADPGSPLAEGLDVRIEQRFTA